MILLVVAQQVHAVQLQYYQMRGVTSGTNIPVHQEDKRYASFPKQPLKLDKSMTRYMN